MKKLLLLAALAVLCGAQAWADADQVRDGADFNTPNCARHYIRRTVDSTGTKAGRLDSAVVICAPQVMPTPMTVGGVYRPDTTSRALSLDSDGNLKAVDPFRDRDNWSLLATVSDTVNSGTGLGVRQFAQLKWTAESTTVAPAFQYRRLWLALRVIPAGGDTTNKVYLAVQVRGHTSAIDDSVNTFAWYGWATTGASAVTVADSIGQFFKGTHPVQASGNPQVAGPSEKLFVFQPGMGYGGILSQGAIFSWPNGIWTPLVDQRGVWFGAPYVSVRVRMLWGTGPVRVIAMLYGAS